ncbi:MAG TPA: hypothetical protein ENL27_01225 [Candidatus Parcubacteria bacterium]|nr:hypothetical protein [Candidatus Parcubacteria bacterium]
MLSEPFHIVSSYGTAPTVTPTPSVAPAPTVSPTPTVTPMPDLAVTKLNVTRTSSDYVNIEFCVKNIGDASAPGGFSARVYNTAYPSSFFTKVTPNVDHYKVGQSNCSSGGRLIYNSSTGKVISGYFKPGINYIEGVVDENNVVAESNESNNVKRVAIDLAPKISSFSVDPTNYTVTVYGKNLWRIKEARLTKNGVVVNSVKADAVVNPFHCSSDGSELMFRLSSKISSMAGLSLSLTSAYGTANYGIGLSSISSTPTPTPTSTVSPTPTPTYTPTPTASPTPSSPVSLDTLKNELASISAALGKLLENLQTIGR